MKQERKEMRKKDISTVYCCQSVIYHDKMNIMVQASTNILIRIFI